MKRKFHNIIIILFSIIILFTQSIISIAAEVNTSIISEKTESKITTAPKAPYIDWRYKIENNQMYKRLYDYTNNVWIGEWILCP